MTTNPIPLEASTLADRLRAQHSDLAQGAYFTPDEDPIWDATLDAAAALEAFRPVIEAARRWRVVLADPVETPSTVALVRAIDELERQL